MGARRAAHMRVVGDGGTQNTAAAASLRLARATPRWRVFAARVTPASASRTLAAEEATSTRSQTRTAQFSTVLASTSGAARVCP